MIDVAALMTRSSWMSALQDGHFILMLLMYTSAVQVYFREKTHTFPWICLGRNPVALARDSDTLTRWLALPDVMSPPPRYAGAQNERALNSG
jgi:hypothetical protein